MALPPPSPPQRDLPGISLPLPWDLQAWQVQTTPPDTAPGGPDEPGLPRGPSPRFSSSLSFYLHHPPSALSVSIQL